METITMISNMVVPIGIMMGLLFIFWGLAESFDFVVSKILSIKNG